MPEYRLIPLRGKYGEGKFTKVSAEDYDRLVQFAWLANCLGYVYTSINGRAVYMHRLVTNAPPSAHVDHKKGDVKDNRRDKLRVCDHKQNQQNQFSVRGSSRYKGVSWCKTIKRWRATIRVDKVKRSLGSFSNEEDAARAYDAAARHHFGKFARTNFDS